MSVNPLTELLLPLLGFEVTTKILGIVFLIPAAALALWPGRRVRLEVLFAICTVLSMFWSYRRGYDCVLLIIPMVLLFEIALAHGGALRWATAILFGLSLWLPVRNEQWLWSSIQILHSAAWVTGGLVLVVNDLIVNPGEGGSKRAVLTQALSNSQNSCGLAAGEQ